MIVMFVPDPANLTKNRFEITFGSRLRFVVFAPNFEPREYISFFLWVVWVGVSSLLDERPRCRNLADVRGESSGTPRKDR